MIIKDIFKLTFAHPLFNSIAFSASSSASAYLPNFALATERLLKSAAFSGSSFSAWL